MAKYINPFVDFGFKYIFGREESKPFLMDFLNSLLATRNSLVSARRSVVWFMTFTVAHLTENVSS